MANKEKMFDAYNQHLNLIRELNITNRTDEYICPICLQGYCKDDLDKLSLEDAPQDALGGKKIAITCANCNNTCGNTIDFHLINYLDIIENKSFLSGTNRKIRIMDLGQGKPIEASFRINDNNEMELLIHRNFFNFPNYKERLDMLVVGKDVSVQDKPIKYDFRYVTAAIMKNAYIILFSKTGYTFLLDEYYNKIRTFITNPETITNPQSLWTIIPNNCCREGIFLSNNKNCRGFYIVYTVSKIKSYKIITYIPSPFVKFEEAISSFHKLRTERNGLLLQELNSQGLLWNKNEIKSIREWTYSKK